MHRKRIFHRRIPPAQPIVAIEFRRRKTVDARRTRVAAVHQDALTHSVDIPVDIRRACVLDNEAVRQSGQPCPPLPITDRRMHPSFRPPTLGRPLPPRCLILAPFCPA